MRQLATIRTVVSTRPIQGADRIEVAQVDGWECVVKKGEFEVGQHIVYVEVDSVMPERPEFEFLRDRKFRVRTIKLRGQVSEPRCKVPDAVQVVSQAVHEAEAQRRVPGLDCQNGRDPHPESHHLVRHRKKEEHAVLRH